MKTLKILSLSLVGLSLVSISACSSMGSKSGDDLAYKGPTVLDVRTNPGTFEMNRNLTPKTDTSVVADVKDFNSNISDVRLRFEKVPLEIPMKKKSGDTWVAELTKSQLRKLAVAGQTMKYQATVIAKNAKGEVSTSKKPVDISVKTPEVVMENS